MDELGMTNLRRVGSAHHASMGHNARQQAPIIARLLPSCKRLLRQISRLGRRRQHFNRSAMKLGLWHVKTLTKILPTTAQGLIDLNQIQSDISTNRGKLVLLIDDLSLDRVDTIEINRAPFELLLNDFQCAPRFDNALLQIPRLPLSLHKLDERVFHFPTRAQHRLL